MSNGERLPSHPGEVEAAAPERRSARSQKAGTAGPATAKAGSSEAGHATPHEAPAPEPDEQSSLASAAEHLAAQLGIGPAPGIDQALNAGGLASRAAVRTHRLIVEFHLGQLDRTLRAGRALTACRSFDDALEVHRGFMQDTLRASATHLRELTDLGLGTVAGKPAARRGS